MSVPPHHQGTSLRNSTSSDFDTMYRSPVSTGSPFYTPHNYSMDQHSRHTADSFNPYKQISTASSFNSYKPASTAEPFNPFKHVNTAESFNPFKQVNTAEYFNPYKPTSTAEAFNPYKPTSTASNFDVKVPLPLYSKISTGSQYPYSPYTRTAVPYSQLSRTASGFGPGEYPRQRTSSDYSRMMLPENVYF